MEHLANVLQHNPELPAESVKKLSKTAAKDDLNDKIASEFIDKFSSSHKSRHSVNALDFQDLRTPEYVASPEYPELPEDTKERNAERSIPIPKVSHIFQTPAYHV